MQPCNLKHPASRTPRLHQDFGTHASTLFPDAAQNRTAQRHHRRTWATRITPTLTANTFLGPGPSPHKCEVMQPQHPQRTGDRGRQLGDKCKIVQPEHPPKTGDSEKQVETSGRQMCNHAAKAPGAPSRSVCDVDGPCGFARRR